jgi:uncharacterized protein (TIGR03503 family)
LMLNRLLKSIVVISFTMMFSAATNAADDVRLLIDISGSMKQNDPENLRIPAVNLLVKLAPPGSDVGVWTFGQSVNMLVPHAEVTKQWKQTAISKTAQINSSGLLTNIGAALEDVLLDLPSGDAAILLTDGVVDISKDPQVNVQERNRILKEVLPRLIAKGVIVHSVALSNNTDEALLQELSKSTGGMFEIATTSGDLMTLFLKMFDDAVPQDQIPITGNEFLVDKSVQEFTLLVFKEPDEPIIQLRTPANKYYISTEHPGYISWYTDLGFDLITVSEPEPGAWKLFTETDDQNRVTVLSDLRLDVTNLENTIYTGDVPDFQVSFKQENRRVINQKFLELLDVQLIVTSPDGSKQGTRLGEFQSGIFGSSLQVFDKVGKYQVKVSVDGKSFKREVVQEIQYQNPIEVLVDQIEKKLLVLPAAKSFLADKLNIIASLGSDNTPTSFLPLVEDSEGFWSASLASFPEGTYNLNLSMSGVTGRGQVVDFKITGKTIDLEDTEAESALNTDFEQDEVDAAIPEDLVTVTEPAVKNESLLTSLLSNSFLVYGIVGLLNLLVIFACIWGFRRRSAGSLEDEELQALLAGKSVAAIDGKTDGGLAAAQEEATAKEVSDDGAAEGFSDIVDGWAAIEEDDKSKEDSAMLDAEVLAIVEGAPVLVEDDELLSVLEDQLEAEPGAREKERALEEAEIAETLADADPLLLDTEQDPVDGEVDGEVAGAEPSSVLADDLELDLSIGGEQETDLDLSVEASSDPDIDSATNESAEDISVDSVPEEMDDERAATQKLEQETVEKRSNA